MRQSRIIMGTGVSIDVPEMNDESLMNKAYARIAQIDRRYSTYKTNSEISKFQRGELSESELSREFKKVMRACMEYEKLTGGYFSAWFNGSFDPTGYVKAMAINEAARIIENAGYGTYCVAIGGDLMAKSNSSKTWRIGVENPLEANTTIGTVEAKNISMATSGNYKRGEHIINPKTHRPAKELLSVTVLGPDIITADVFATAAFVIGKKAQAFIARHKGYGALIVDKDKKIRTTEGLSELFGQLKLDLA